MAARELVAREARKCLGSVYGRDEGHRNKSEAKKRGDGLMESVKGREGAETQ